jgi:hypothetical protein
VACGWEARLARIVAIELPQDLVVEARFALGVVKGARYKEGEELKAQGCQARELASAQILDHQGT